MNMEYCWKQELLDVGYVEIDGEQEFNEEEEMAYSEVPTNITFLKNTYSIYKNDKNAVNKTINDFTNKLNDFPILKQAFISFIGREILDFDRIGGITSLLLKKNVIFFKRWLNTDKNRQKYFFKLITDINKLKITHIPTQSKIENSLTDLVNAHLINKIQFSIRTNYVINPDFYKKWFIERENIIKTHTHCNSRESTFFLLNKNISSASSYLMFYDLVNILNSNEDSTEIDLSDIFLN